MQILSDAIKIMIRGQTITLNAYIFLKCLKSVIWVYNLIS